MLYLQTSKSYIFVTGLMSERTQPANAIKLLIYV